MSHSHGLLHRSARPRRSAPSYRRLCSINFFPSICEWSTVTTYVAAPQFLLGCRLGVRDGDREAGGLRWKARKMMPSLNRSPVDGARADPLPAVPCLLGEQRSASRWNQIFGRGDRAYPTSCPWTVDLSGVSYWCCWSDCPACCR
jgi:hypothetical protein